MPSNEAADLRGLSEGDLRARLEDSHRALFNLRFQARTRQLADVSQVGAARRRIARLKTLLREREILAAYEAAGEAAPPAMAAVAQAASEAPPAVEAKTSDDDAASEVESAPDDGETSDAEEQE